MYQLGIFVRDKKIYVADTSNSRVQVIPLSIFFDIIPPKISVQNSPERFINENSFNITFKVSDDKTPQDKINIYIDINGNGFNKISVKALAGFLQKRLILQEMKAIQSK